MTLVESLIEEFEHEAATTRRHLERLPEDKLDWRPHPKSFSARGLASHIVECVRWGEAIFSRAEIDFDPVSYKPYEAASVAELLAAYDEAVATCQRAMAGATDAHLAQPWRLKIGGRQRFEKPRPTVFRDFSVSHVIHHRGQLSVYLRLLDVPVPGSYGPSADEQG